MPRVFVPHVPSKYDREMQQWVPTMDLTKTAPHGELIVMLPPNASRIGVASCVETMRAKMLERFRPGDYLVAVGDPSLFASAACIAAKLDAGRLRMLKWDRMVSDYIAVEVRT